MYVEWKELGRRERGEGLGGRLTRMPSETNKPHMSAHASSQGLADMCAKRCVRELRSKPLDPNPLVHKTTST